MARLVCLALNDGRWVIAGVDDAMARDLRSAMKNPDRMLSLIGDDRIDQIRSDSIYAFRFADSEVLLPPGSEIYRFAAC